VPADPHDAYKERLAWKLHRASALVDERHAVVEGLGDRQRGIAGSPAQACA
jgi:hypothetical protein